MTLTFNLSTAKAKSLKAVFPNINLATTLTETAIQQYNKVNFIQQYLLYFFHSDTQVIYIILGKFHHISWTIICHKWIWRDNDNNPIHISKHKRCVVIKSSFQIFDTCVGAYIRSVAYSTWERAIFLWRYTIHVDIKIKYPIIIMFSTSHREYAFRQPGCLYYEF